MAAQPAYYSVRITLRLGRSTSIGVVVDAIRNTQALTFTDVTLKIAICASVDSTYTYDGELDAGSLDLLPVNFSLVRAHVDAAGNGAGRQVVRERLGVNQVIFVASADGENTVLVAPRVGATLGVGVDVRLVVFAVGVGVVAGPDGLAAGVVVLDGAVVGCVGLGVGVVRLGANGEGFVVGRGGVRLVHGNSVAGRSVVIGGRVVDDDLVRDLSGVGRKRRRERRGADQNRKGQGKALGRCAHVNPLTTFKLRNHKLKGSLPAIQCSPSGGT